MMASHFVIEDGLPPPQGPARRGRRVAAVPLRAADAVRNGECQSIREAANRFFDEHAGFATTAAERADDYAERFRDFVLMIVADLKRSPGPFDTYRRLGELHAEKMQNQAYRRSHHAKLLKRLREELKSIGVVD